MKLKQDDSQGYNPYNQNQYGQNEYNNNSYGQNNFNNPYGMNQYNYDNFDNHDNYAAQYAHNQYGQSQYGAEAYPRDEISPQAYNLIIGGMLLYGFLVNCFMITFCFDMIEPFVYTPMAFYISYFVMVIIGSLMIKHSANPVINFIGYNFIVVPIGLVLSFTVNIFSLYGYSSTITAAFGVTAIVTLSMMFVSSIFPDFFLSLGRTLFVTLIITIIAESIMFAFGVGVGAIDFIVVVIFCGYVGYDWVKANTCVKTVSNAINSACELYLDIVNLFLRILRILARAQRN